MFRFRGLYFAIATLVLGTALGVFMVNWNGLGGAVGLFLSTYAPSAQATTTTPSRWPSSPSSSSTSSCARASA